MFHWFSYNFSFEKVSFRIINTPFSETTRKQPNLFDEKKFRLLYEKRTCRLGKWRNRVRAPFISIESILYHFARNLRIFLAGMYAHCSAVACCQPWTCVKAVSLNRSKKNYGRNKWVPKEIFRVQKLTDYVLPQSNCDTWCTNDDFDVRKSPAYFDSLSWILLGILWGREKWNNFGSFLVVIIIFCSHKSLN